MASFLFPSTITLIDAAETAQASPQDIGEVLTALVMNIVSNPVDALMNANYIGILAWAIVLGIAMRAASDNTKQVFTNVSEAVSKVVRWVIACAPFGILGLVYTTVSENGLEIFTEYGHLLLVLVGCMLFIAFIVNPLMVWINIRKNPYPLVWRCIKESGLYAFLYPKLCRKHSCEHGALPQAWFKQGYLFRFYPLRRNYQYGRCCSNYCRYDTCLL